MKVVSVASEVLVVLDPELEQEIAGGAAELARLSSAANPHLAAVNNACWHPDADGLGLTAESELHRRSANRIEELKGDLGLKILALATLLSAPLLCARATAEYLAKQVAKTTAGTAPRRSENIVEVNGRAASATTATKAAKLLGGSRRLCVEANPKRIGAKLVVEFAFLVVAEHLVGRSYTLKPFRSTFAGVLVRVKFRCQLAVDFFDLLLARGSGDPQHGVKILHGVNVGSEPGAV